MESHNIIHFQEVKNTVSDASQGLKAALLLEPSTGFVYPIRENDYRWNHTNENSTIHINDREMFYLTDEIASWVLSRKECGILTCSETGEKVLIPGQFLIGRINAWAEGTLNDLRVSRVHGKITCDNTTYTLTVSPVPTKNGTFLNHELLSPDQEIELHDQDVIRVGRFHLIFSRISLVKRNLEELDLNE